MGITPIEEMLEILDRPDAIPATRMSRWTEPAEGGSWLAPQLGSLRPALTPVFASGFASGVIDDLRKKLAPYGLVPVQGVGGVDADLPEAPL